MRIFLNTGDWLRDLVGIKYTAGGRNPDEGFFCFGLVQYVMEQLGKRAPDQENPHGWPEIYQNMGWPCAVRRYDVIVMETPKGTHVGVAVDSEEMIHAWEQTQQVSLEPIARHAHTIRTVARPK